MASFYKQSLLFCALFFCALAIVGALPAKEPPTYLPHQRRALENPRFAKRHNVSNYEILQAQKLLADAAAQQSVYNTYRVEHPQRNTYTSRHSDGAKSASKKRDNAPLAPSLNATVLAAASLLAEHHAAAQNANGTLHRKYKQPQALKGSDGVFSNEKRAAADYWVSEITHTGHAPMGSDSSYMVYRDVTNPIFAGGAKGDGLTDDTAAINAAIAYQSNCGANCLSSTTKGTLIYFPPGTYLISTPINAYYYSQLVGDPNNLPIIKTSPLFIGLGAIQSDVYYTNGNGGEWYIEQSNFYRQVRNLMIDITDTTTASVAGLHWQVAQATSLTNVLIYASITNGTTQMGLFTENGSGGFMSGCYIQGGQYGIYGGNQQYTVRDFQIEDQTTSGICLLWDWGWTWSGLIISGTPTGITLINPGAPSGQQAGSIYLMDSLFDGVKTAIMANFPKLTILETSIITLDNIGVLDVDTMVAFSNGGTLDIPVADIDFIIIGNAELDGSVYGLFNVAPQLPPPSLQGSTTYYRESYFAKNRPQYEDIAVSSVISVKDHGAKGDGVTDDTAAIEAALALATTSNLIYFPAGSYIITSTIVIPPNTRMTGEVWSQLVASGTYFADMTDPKAMIQAGSEGDVGTVEISDMLFTSIGALPGLVLLEWNVQAEEQGSVGMWDTHFRVGGAYGTKLQVAQCPKSEPIQTGCIAATMMMHVTPSSDGYFENVWAWVADHDIDDPTNTQITVAVARGILIESGNGPTWFYGTASEHSILYQYNFFNTTNSFAGMIQTESPYFQYTAATASPGPFNSSVGLYNGDPIFPDGTCNATDLLCDFAWAVMIQEVTNLTIAGAGLYSWFDNYDQSVCVDAQDCQQRLVNNGGYNSGLFIWNLITIGAVEMISDTETGLTILAANNTQAIAHPFWSALGAYLDDYEEEILSCLFNDTDAICTGGQPDCDVSLNFETLDDLAAASGTFPDECTDAYAIGTLSNMLNDTMVNYTAVNSGYDELFNDYVTFTKDMVQPVLKTFIEGPSPGNMNGGPGNKYFQCTYTDAAHSVTQQCPFTAQQIGYSDDYTITFTLTNSTGFYNDLQTNYGINSSWVKFGTNYIIQDCAGAGGGGGGGGDGGVKSGCVRQNIEYIGYPMPADTITVPNPKDIITAALPTISALQNTIGARNMDINIGGWYGPDDDVLQVISMPVFMINQAVNSMAQVKSVGETAAKQDKLNLILEILGIVFIFIPFLDDLTPELELLDGVFNLVSQVGNVALSIQSIVADPLSAPMDILGLLTAGGTRDESDFASMAAKRRGIEEDDLAKIGSDFAATDSKFQNIIKRTCF